MDKKFIINRVDLGQRVTGYEVFNPGVNGGEVIGKRFREWQVQNISLLGSQA